MPSPSSRRLRVTAGGVHPERIRCNPLLTVDARPRYDFEFSRRRASSVAFNPGGGWIPRRAPQAIRPCFCDLTVARWRRWRGDRSAWARRPGHGPRQVQPVDQPPPLGGPTLGAAAAAAPPTACATALPAAGCHTAPVPAPRSSTWPSRLRSTIAPRSISARRSWVV